MNNKEIAQYALEALKKAGTDKAQCKIINSEKHELNGADKKISLLRTTLNTSIILTGIIADQKGTTTINKTDKDSIDKAVKEIIELANSSKPDPANDISPLQPEKSFQIGPQKPDTEKMYSRMKEFLAHAEKAYPITNFENMIFDYNKNEVYVANSNGVSLSSSKGSYRFFSMIISKEGENTSSFNSAGCEMLELDKPLKDLAGIDRIIKQSAQQIKTSPIPENFVGNVVITPECLYSFLYNLTGYLSDYAIITGNSVFLDSVGKQIATPEFTLHSMPKSEKLAGAYNITADGFEAQNSTIIEKGVLKDFMLSLFGANKTGNKRAVNSGSCYVIEPGSQSYDELIKNTKQGILLCRFSGGRPNDNGDFSGIAKNSFYIENGEIKHPISETMVSGNIVEMFKNIKGISKELINNGAGLTPWIKFDGVTVSGK